MRTAPRQAGAFRYGQVVFTFLRRPPGRRRPLWWWEVALVALAYWLYAVVRDAHGRASGQQLADAHGRAVGHVERSLHLDLEHGVQQLFLHSHWLLRLVGGFYGSAHFVVTFGTLAYLLTFAPDAYRRWRRLLGVTTMVAVGVFALYPTAPPRLLPDSDVQDTLATVGGLWSYNSGVLEHITDPFAAMPSLHLAWACWVAAALATTVGAGWSARRRWLFALYPAAVTVTVLATGVHWLLDALAGTALFVLVWWADLTARTVALPALGRAWARRRAPDAGPRPGGPPADREPAAPAWVD